MDILNIINGYIEKKKDDYKHPSSEIADLLNGGKAIETISSQYGYPSEKIVEILEESNYFYDKVTGLWELQNYDSSLTDKKKNFLEQNQVFFSDSASVNTQEKGIPGTNKNEQYENLDLEKICNSINEGISIDFISKQNNMTVSDLKNLLIANQYYYYDFMNYWSKLEEKELFEELIHLLDTGLTIYDLSGKYVRGSKNRIRFVSTLEKLLNNYNYNYNSKNKKWEKEDVFENIPKIIELINSGKSMKDVAVIFKTQPSALRFTLKKENYHYNHLLNIWTKQNQIDLLKNVAAELLEGTTTIEELKKREINIKSLLNELDKHDFIYSQESFNNSLNADNKEPHSYLSIPIETPNKKYRLIKNEKLIFNTEEINTLKELIHNWNVQRHASNNNEQLELSIFINQSLLTQLTNTSEIEGLSRSKIIEKALKKYF
ncbi:hypothetical protein ACQKIC_01465 [Peribacillus sp. NPDC046944]|uniref:hypothetical protein n=1 Tax=unclassified Peribacillus TaxID=2675266 RepID=UPI003D05053C